VSKPAATVDAEILDSATRTIAVRTRAAAGEDLVKRIWAKDDTVWGPAGQPEVANRLGWLTIADRMKDSVDRLQDFAAKAAADGLTDCVLLGMGGSSLAPEVFWRSFGAKPRALKLHVLDTTDAAAIAAAPTENTLYLVSSKSGGTLETLSAMAHFWKLTGEDPSRFAAVTDPHTSLESLAKERGYREVFLADPDIGGRYSALSYFGLVPAALIGADIEALLAGAIAAAERCQARGDENSGLWLGVALGELALEGHDKLTFAVDEPLSALGLWAEQLVAESLGKHGKGILPIADEPLAKPRVYGNDRVFLHVRSESKPEHDKPLAAVAEHGHPLLTISFSDANDLGAVMFVLEFATAVAGWALSINPFDQPNVQSAKDKTKEVLEQGSDPIEPATDAALAKVLDSTPPSYLALQVYAAPSPAIDAAMAKLRAALVAKYGYATTFGYGPRYLHSTGQLHKGGPPTGRFLQLVSTGHKDIEIPGQRFSFEQLKRAQADGDLLTLRAAGLPAERLILDGDLEAVITRIEGNL
jgi:glucose-6-phosphate isomerase